MRLCIPCLLASVALALWSAAVWGQPPGSPPETSPQLDAARILRLLDANKDGSVSAEEVKGFFQRADSDRDGSLSEDELAKALTAPAPTPSIVKGQPAGIEVGQCPPDFELQPIEPYAKLREWLGDGAPKSIEEKVKLSQLVGKQPILLLYGSYT